MRGEHRNTALTSADAGGSPPLARGTYRAHRDEYSGDRITPACAGNIYGIEPAHARLQDHPRLRGEHWGRGNSPNFRIGSPPLARGTCCCAPWVEVCARITPACAGNILESSQKGVARHGSPPLARGTLYVKLFYMTEMRITPACAGNMLQKCVRALLMRDHPRLRGEHTS